MFCMKCGTKLPDNAVFCFFCGEKLEEVISDATATEKPCFISANEKTTEESEETESLQEISETEVTDTIVSETTVSLSEEQKENDENAEAESESSTQEDDLLDSEADMSKLSTFKAAEESKYRDETTSKEEEPVYVTNPDLDPYWDDVLPEIEKEISRIPKDIIVKGIGIVVTLLLVMTWLIFSGPQ